MSVGSKVVGGLLAVAGFLLAVPLAYILLNLDNTTFIKLLKLLFIILLVIVGALLTATGTILFLGWPKTNETLE